MNLLRLFGDVASAYVHQCDVLAAARDMIDQAFWVAMAEKTVTRVIVPAEVKELDAQPKQPHPPQCPFRRRLSPSRACPPGRICSRRRRP